MNLYLKVIALLVMLVFVFGFAAPYLISADSTELVLGGFGLILLVAIPLGFKLVKGIFKDGKVLVESFANKEESK